MSRGLRANRVTRHCWMRHQTVVRPIGVFTGIAVGGASVQHGGVVNVDPTQHCHQRSQEGQDLLTCIFRSPFRWSGRTETTGFRRYPLEVGLDILLLVRCAQPVPVVLVDVRRTRRTTAGRSETTFRVRHWFGRRNRMNPWPSDFPLGLVGRGRWILVGRCAWLGERLGKDI